MFNDTIIVKSVEDGGEWLSISTTESGGFGLDKKYGVFPVPGDEITLYFENGFGTPIRGMDLNGKSIFYKSDNQLKQECQEWLENNKRERQEEFNKNKKQMGTRY